MLLGLPVSVILLDCIAAAAALVYAPFLVVALARLQLGYDQAAPRAMFDRLPDYAQRATWAHQNSFETFMLFSAAALMAYGAFSSLPRKAPAIAAIATRSASRAGASAMRTLPVRASGFPAAWQGTAPRA